MKRRVLLAVDDAELVATLQTLLWALDYELLVARDGASAQALALVQRPHVIIIDIDLPSGGGRELTRRLQRQAETHSLPIVLLACQPAQEDYRFAFAHGVSKFLTRPFRPIELIHAVDELVERCRSERA